MLQIVDHPKPQVFPELRASKRTKLASAVISGEIVFPVDETAVKSAVEKAVGIFHPVDVSIANDQITIRISSVDEILEGNGLMQLAIFNVLKILCQEFGLSVLNVENEFLPDYA